MRGLVAPRRTTIGAGGVGLRSTWSQWLRLSQTMEAGMCQPFSDTQIMTVGRKVDIVKQCSSIYIEDTSSEVRLMRITIRKWGNSAALRLPASIIRDADLSLDTEVDVREEQGRVIIEPLVSGVSLDELLSGITDENLHGEESFGQAEGKEVF